MSSGSFLLGGQLDHALPLLVLHLVPPQPVLVELREAVHHDRDGEREDEDAGEGAEASNQFSQECLGVEVISDSCNGHKAPPADEEKQLIVFFIGPESDHWERLSLTP